MEKSENSGLHCCLLIRNQLYGYLQFLSTGMFDLGESQETLGLELGEKTSEDAAANRSWDAGTTISGYSPEAVAPCFSTALSVHALP